MAGTRRPDRPRRYSLFLAFLHPYAIRGVKAPLLWVFYRLVNQFGREAVFLLSEDYLATPESLRAEGRWEVSLHGQIALDYKVPSDRALAELRCEFAPETWALGMNRRFGDDHLGSWRHFLTEEDVELQAWIEQVVRRWRMERGTNIEAIFVWNNCVALRSAAGAMGIPLLHWELGNLRAPQFQPTVYLDFQSVNGNTECEARFRRLQQHDDYSALPQLTAHEMLALLAREPVAASQEPEFELGVPLQVDDDSNLVAFGNGYDNEKLIDRALAFASSPNKVLVRGYPGRADRVPAGAFTLDDSAGSVEFISRCARIVTINSSVGAEALLMGRPVVALGDSPFSFIARMPIGSAEQFHALAFYFLCYLVPRQMVFDPDYVRWRLTKPRESEIAERHLRVLQEAWAGGRVAP